MGGENTIVNKAVLKVTTNEWGLKYTSDSFSFIRFFLTIVVEIVDYIPLSMLYFNVVSQ